VENKKAPQRKFFPHPFRWLPNFAAAFPDDHAALRHAGLPLHLR
jgi:hypothetical protein